MAEHLETNTDPDRVDPPSESSVPETPVADKSTFRFPVVGSLFAIFSTIGLFISFFVGLYLYLLQYAFYSERYFLVGANSQEDLQVMYGRVLSIIGLEAHLALFFVFWGLLGFLVVGVIKRGCATLLLFTYSFFAFLCFVNVILVVPGRNISLFQLISVVISVIAIYFLIPILVSLNNCAGDAMPAWKRYLPLLVPIGAALILVISGGLLFSVLPSGLSATYELAPHFPKLIALISIAWIFLNLITISEAIRKRRK